MNQPSGAVLLREACGPGHADGGSIANIGSINGIQPLPTLVAYGAAKGGLLALTRTLANAYDFVRPR